MNQGGKVDGAVRGNSFLGGEAGAGDDGVTG